MDWIVGVSVAVALSFAIGMAVLAYTSETFTAFYVGELADGGTTHCSYEYMDNLYIRTVPSHTLCPISIEVEI
jgi:hypothetical protein